MGAYRSRAECREIVRAIIAETSVATLESFGLDKAEQNFFRIRAARGLNRIARDTATFKRHYRLPVARPLWNLIIASTVMIVATVSSALLFYHFAPPSTDKMPLVTGSVAVIVAAVGWVVAGGFAHRNTIRQNTNAMLVARYTQAPVVEALHRFSREFGYDEKQPVTLERIEKLRATGEDGDWRAANSVGFVLNYFEIIANGVIRGDLDHRIVSDTIRGMICFYHDKCEPFILEAARESPTVYEQLRKLRAHYRDP